MPYARDSRPCTGCGTIFVISKGKCIRSDIRKSLNLERNSVVSQMVVFVFVNGIRHVTLALQNDY